jgi:nucleoside-diphosphate-sugar epimerase
MACFAGRRDITLRGFSSKDCDLLNPASIKESLSFLNEDSAVIFTSAITRVVDNSGAALLKNLGMAVNLRDFLGGRKIAGMVYLSTIDVYGLVDDDVVITESALPKPNDNYAVSKLASEYILRQEAEHAGYPLCVLRLPGVYGPGGQGKSAVWAMADSARRHGRITVFGDGSNLRDFVAASDIGAAAESALRGSVSVTVNMATGSGLPVKDIARLVLEGLGLPDERLVFQPEPRLEGSAKRVRHLRFDTSLLRRLMPDLKMTPMTEGIKEYLEMEKESGLEPVGSENL